VLINLLVEGWRRSSHSYALVNQHQLSELACDPRFKLFHVDIPFLDPKWAGADAGLGYEARRLIDGLGAPPSSPDVIYRISWPLRVHRGNAPRIFVFGTSEFQLLQPRECCGPSGTAADVDRGAVDIITPSQWSRAGFIASGFEESRVHVIPHGVDVNLHRAGDADERHRSRSAMNIPEDAHVFLSIGSMQWNKGIDLLVAAFAVLRQRSPRVILLLKGAEELYGSEIAARYAEAHRLVSGGIPQFVFESIKYSGRNFPSSFVAKLYRASDAYLAPYRAEGFNLPALEALASGVVPVVTRGGATDDFCPDHLSLKIESRPARLDQGGRFLEPLIESIVAGMQRSIDDDALRRRVASEGPRWVAERYSWSRVCRTLADQLLA
jgi:glycosyltransferase involved in cell wall biosynthesis